eukprot:Lankesteria_metandrocarpae@DN5255_c0_g1_i1.p3
MGPKKDERGQQKAEEKRKVKVAEDKTFGLKNKNKSKAVQKFIKGVQAQARPNQKSEQARLDAQLQQKEDKKKQAQQDALLASLFKGAENMKTLGKGDSASVPEQKIDLYVDKRDNKDMASWNQEELESVIQEKHGEDNAMSTGIVCKFFLDAVEKKQYGWFWTCPGGGDTCKYRHCLPPGYVLKVEEDKAADLDDEDENLEEMIERERAALPSGGTMVTLESFKLWKQKCEQQRLANVEAKRLAESKKTGGRGLEVLSGRDLFTYDPTLFIDGEGAASDGDYEEDEVDDNNNDDGDDNDGDDNDGDDNDSDDGDDPSDDEGSPQLPGASAAAAPSSSAALAPIVEGTIVNRPDLFLEEVEEDLDLDSLE